MKPLNNSRRDFIKKTAITGVASYLGTLGLSAKSYNRIIGANEIVRVGIMGVNGRGLALASTIQFSMLNVQFKLNKHHLCWTQ